MKKAKQEKVVTMNPVLVGLLGVGLLLIGISFASNIPTYLELATVRVEHPDHARFEAYDNLIRKYVHGGFVDYEKMKNSPELTTAIDELKRTSSDRLTTDDQRIAYWANAYNLCSLKNIADHYPVRNLGELTDSRGIRRFIVGGQPITIKDIDSEQLRPLIKSVDWRVLFLMCPGAIGYPHLPDRAFREEHMNEQLTGALKAFVLRPDNYEFDDDRRKLYISEFYSWNRNIIDSVYQSPAILLNSCLPESEQFDIGTYPYSYGLKFDWRIADLKLFVPKKEEPPKPHPDRSAAGEGIQAVGADKATPSSEVK